ncbi:MAG: type 2 lanthipeptide synthetase LanM [Nakamurella sp.]
MPSATVDKVTAAFLDRYRTEIDSAADDPAHGLPAALVRSAVQRCIEQRLGLLTPRVFVVEFHEFRRSLGLPVDAGSDTASRQYTENFDAGVVADWCAKYPVFGDLVDSVVRQSVTHVGEICARFAADRANLEAAGFLPPQAVLEEIQHLGSDSHNQGRMVAALRFAGGQRIIYKPRTLGPEVLTRACLRQISPAVGFDLTDCAPASLDRGSYGWQQEVTQVNAGSEADVRQYYRAFGAVSALMAVLGATDMHHENVVAAGDHPVLVDLETVLHTDMSLATSDLSSALSARVKLSLASTVLLPQRLPTGPYSVLMAGIGVPWEQRSERTDFVLVDRDTDAVDIAKRTFRYTHTANVLRRSDGSNTDVLDYGREFLDGFRRGYRAVAAERDALALALTANPVRIRQIFRSTAVYGRILNAATHPDNLRSRAAFERVIGMLRTPMGYDRPYVREFITDAEKAALAGGDVPYFVVPSDDVRLEAGGFCSVPYCDLGPADRARTGLQLVDERALAFEELIIEEGMSELRAVRFRNDPTYRPAHHGPFSNCFGPEGVDVDGVVQRLRQVAVRATSVDGLELGWVGGAHGPEMATYDPGTCISLHDAGGIAVLFERLAGIGSLAADGDLAQVRRGVQSLRRRYRESLEGVPLSVASGPISLEYALDPAASRLPAAEATVIAALSSGQELAAADLMKGLPGAGLLLASYPDTPDDLLEQMLAATAIDEPGKGPWDLAHGGLGLAWARHRLLTRLGAVDDARAQAWRLAAALDPVPGDLPRAWCSGYGGLLMVAAELSVDAEFPLEELAVRATTLPPVGRPIDLSVCHGAAGVVQSLIRLANSIGEQWPLAVAAEYWARVGKHAQDEGYFTGDREKQALLGYFLGWSGIADTGLQLAEAIAGQSVWVPTAFARRLEGGAQR